MIRCCEFLALQPGGPRRRGVRTALAIFAICWLPDARTADFNGDGRADLALLGSEVPLAVAYAEQMQPADGDLGVYRWQRDQARITVDTLNYWITLAKDYAWSEPMLAEVETRLAAARARLDGADLALLQARGSFAFDTAALELFPLPETNTADDEPENSAAAVGLPSTDEHVPLLLLAGNFDADEADELLVRRLDNGSWSLYDFYGGSLQPIESLLPQSLELEVIGTGDFNGDGRDDVLLRHTETGVWSIFLMDGADPYDSNDAVSLDPDPRWEWKASADFNNDGSADILLYDAASGLWQLALMNGTFMLESPASLDLGESIADSVVAIADIDRDGRADLLSRSADGDWRIHLFDDAAWQFDNEPLAIDPNLQFEAVGDFDGDGFADLLLRNKQGDWYLAVAGNTDRFDTLRLGLPADPALKVISVADHNADGAEDLLLERAGTRLVWFGEKNPRLWRDFASVELTITSLPDVGEARLACAAPVYFPGEYHSGAPIGNAPAARLRWSIPRFRENGEPLCRGELAGYDIFYYTDDLSFWRLESVSDPLLTSIEIGDLEPGNYRFGVRSQDTRGFYSRLSPIVRKHIN